MIKRNLILLLLIFPVGIFAQTLDKNIKTPQQVMMESKEGVRNISAEELKKKLDSGENVIVLDVRTRFEYMEGYIKGSVSMPRSHLEFKVQGICKDSQAEIVVYCKSGGRSALAYHTLESLGYKNILNLEGGILSWEAKGYSLSRDRAE